MMSLRLSKRVLKTPIKTLTTLTWQSLLSSPDSTCVRGFRVNASHVRPGNVIEKSGRIYQVVDAEHKQRGRGGAMMQMELRDVDTGNKLSLRFGTEEAVERVFVEDKSFTCLYTERDLAFLIDPQTFEQMKVPLELFGEAAAYLKAEMDIRLQLYDGRPLSGSVPKRVTCTIKETQTPMKGVTATPRYVLLDALSRKFLVMDASALDVDIIDSETTEHLKSPLTYFDKSLPIEKEGTTQRLVWYKRALLDNGLTIQVPAYLEIDEEIFINTEDHSFISRANK